MSIQENDKLLMFKNPQKYYSQSKLWDWMFGACQKPIATLASKVSLTPFDIDDVAYVLFSDIKFCDPGRRILRMYRPFGDIDKASTFFRLTDGRFCFLAADQISNSIYKDLRSCLVSDTLDNIVRFGLTEELRQKYNFQYDTDKSGFSFEKIEKELTND